MLHQQTNNDANHNKEVGQRKAELASMALPCSSRVYLDVVVVRQTLAVESHPPPLENTLPTI